MTNLKNALKIDIRVSRIVAGEFRKGSREESPGSIEQWCWITSSEGDLKESATENNRRFGKGEKVR